MSLERSNENIIEWYTGVKTASLTIGQNGWISKVKKLKERFPEEVEIWENKDGSIFAHVPLSWIKINPKRVLSEEQRAEYAERLKKARDAKE